MTQNLVSIFKSSLKLGFNTKPRFKHFVIPAIEFKVNALHVNDLNYL